MTLHALALAALMRHCAPDRRAVNDDGDRTSGKRRRSARDRRQYHEAFVLPAQPRELRKRLARRLLDAGHSLDLGIAQIDSMNFAGFGVNVHTIFDPCIESERRCEDTQRRLRLRCTSDMVTARLRSDMRSACTTPDGSTPGRATFAACWLRQGFRKGTRGTGSARCETRGVRGS